MIRRMRTFYEFFAGAGMARAGLGPEWECLFANDIDAKKGASYAANWGAEGLRVCDVAALTTGDIPERVDLCWASPPCQDLSEAGGRAGLIGERSGAFWPWWRLLQGLRAEARAPKIITIENVTGLLSSHRGQDFEAIRCALIDAGYRVGALQIDAALFVPQSRERVFIIAVDADVDIPAKLLMSKPTMPFHPYPLIAACDPLAAGKWDRPLSDSHAPLWWRLPVPPTRNMSFADIVEDEPTGVSWNTQAETRRVLSMMSDFNLEKVEAAKRAGKRMAGGLYRRTRLAKDGAKVSRWEVRFDGLAGCLRTAAGGSSIQSILVVDSDTIRMRRLTPRECARLMGLSDSYALPANASDGYDLVGDGVAVPVVRHIAAHILEPIVAASRSGLAAE